METSWVTSEPAGLIGIASSCSMHPPNEKSSRPKPGSRRIRFIGIDSLVLIPLVSQPHDRASSPSNGSEARRMGFRT